MKSEYVSISMRVGAPPVFEEVAKHRPEIASDGAPAALQFRQGTWRTPKHPVQILAEAYRLAVETES